MMTRSLEAYVFCFVDPSGVDRDLAVASLVRRTAGNRIEVLRTKINPSRRWFNRMCRRFGPIKLWRET
jgi:hypothetical protein